MSTPRTFGRPAAHASQLAKCAAVRICYAGAVGLAAAALAVAAAARSMSAATVQITWLACLAVFCGASWQVQQQRVAWGKAAAGSRSERAVGKALASCGAAAVVHGALLGAGGDVDHVVAGPWLVVVETKTGFGPVMVSGTALVASRPMRGDPVGQATRQAVRLTKLTGLPASAIVCVAGMTNAPLCDRGVFICAPRDLARVLRSLPRVLEREEGVQIAAWLHAGMPAAK